MAIAALAGFERADDPGDVLELPWPRPVLRVVPSGSARTLGEPPDGDEKDEDVPAAAVAPRVRRGIDVGARRAARARLRRRRRRLVLAATAAGLCAGLALPLSILGASAPQSLRVPGTTLTGSTVYIVHPGDTLWSIAARFDRGGDPRPLAEAMGRETGSATVVPGERIVIP